MQSSHNLDNIHMNLLPSLVGLGGLRVTCLPQDPRFAGSKPAEVVGFFQDVKILSTSLPEVLSLRFQAH